MDIVDTTGYSQTAVEYRLVIQQVTVFCKRREGASNSTLVVLLVLFLLLSPSITKVILVW